VFVVAAATLAESWHAAKNAAEAGGRPWPWMWPVTLEAFIFVLVLVYWDARSDGRRAPGTRVLLALTTAVASTIQVLDAPATWLGWLTAAWTPVALLLTIEFATWLLYGSAQTVDVAAAVVTTPTAAAVPPEPPPDAPALAAGTAAVAAATEAPKLQQPARQPTPQERRKIDVRLRRGWSGKRIAVDAGISERVVHAYLREHAPASSANAAQNGGQP
jgi:hypothetical protein